MEPQFVTIAKFRTVPESDFYRSLLEAQGFDAYTRGTAAFNAMPFFGIIERIRLQVPADQARDAIDFLRQQPSPQERESMGAVAEEEFIHEAEADEAKEDHCPNCGATMLPPPPRRIYGRVILAFWAGCVLGIMQGGPNRVELGVVSGLIVACCMGVYLVSRRRSWTCEDCGWESDGQI